MPTPAEPALISGDGSELFAFFEEACAFEVSVFTEGSGFTGDSVAAEGSGVAEVSVFTEGAVVVEASGFDVDADACCCGDDGVFIKKPSIYEGCRIYRNIKYINVAYF
ncbi:hypothetical protein [Vibrio chagasii]|uniref:hypothetical protein n=1 Tax=Vibrio chagasii TaxID=170679 RepID=UPI003735E58E